jgi:dCMP deaminase
VRPSPDEYFLNLVDAVALRSTCDRGRQGCVIVRDKRIITTGYAGSPPGMPHCDEVGHLIREVTYEDGSKKQHCMRTLHAEENAILQGARFGVALEGATLYCRMEPCRACSMKILAVGIARVIARRRYQAGADARELLGDRLQVWEDLLEQYSKD